MYGTSLENFLKIKKNAEHGPPSSKDVRYILEEWFKKNPENFKNRKNPDFFVLKILNYKFCPISTFLYFLERKQTAIKKYI